MTMFCKTIPMPLGRLSPTATRRGRFKKVSFDQLLLQCIVSFGSHPMCKLLEQIPSPMLTLFLIQNIPQYISISMMSPSLDLLCPSHTSLPPVPNFFLLFLFFLSSPSFMLFSIERTKVGRLEPPPPPCTLRYTSTGAGSDTIRIRYADTHCIKRNPLKWCIRIRVSDEYRIRILYVTPWSFRVT